ncbi:MAG: NEW3 domain-containing protein [Candidatus Aenigmatarchaeota archaeon]
MKKIILSVFISLILIPSISLALTCTVSTSCNAVTVFKISSLTNAHAELPSQTNYGYYICCNENGLGNSCSGTYSLVLKLSSSTNAHVEEKTYTNYANSVCLSITSGTIDCQYADNDCSALGSDYVCLASISSRTNAHVGDCNAYPRKICCKAVPSGPPTCVRNNPTVTVIPQSQSTNNPGVTLTYNVNVSNNDNSNCGSSTFSLSVNCPTGWTCTLAQNSLKISPGGVNSTSLSVTSPSSASPGSYSFTVRAINDNDASYSGQATGSYVINPPNTYTLTVETQIDVLSKPLTSVKVNVSNDVKYTDSAGKTTYSLSPGSYFIKAEDLVGTRPFSHFWDHDANNDCNQNDALDTSANPFTFTMAACERTITIWYKVFTHFENLDYDGTKISGYLLREDGNPIHYDVQIDLSYFDGSWHPIGSVTVPSTNGYFEYSWNLVPGTTKIKAEFIPQDWFYVGSSAEKLIGVVGCVGDLSLTITGSDTCTVNARVTASNCDGKNFEVKDENGNVKCTGSISGNNFLYDCTPWDVNSDGGTTYTYKLFIDGVENDTEQVTCNPSSLIDFDAWLGIKELSATLGQTFPVIIYVKNTGNSKDSYEFSVQTSSSNVQARLYDRELANILPGSIVYTKVEVKVLALSSQGENVKVIVTSKSSGKSKELTINLKVGSSSMSDLDTLSILLVLGIALVIFLIKRMYSH